MDLDSNTELKQAEIQNSVQIAVHKKAIEQEVQTLRLIEDLPNSSNLPGVGGGVDLTA